MTKKRKLSVWNKRAGKISSSKLLKKRTSEKSEASSAPNSKAAIFAKKFTKQIKKAVK